MSVLVGPTALAFFSGGYFDEARAWAGAAAWALAALGAIVGPSPIPRTRAVRVALCGLALLAAWTLASMSWALAPGSAYHAGQLVLLYLGGLLAATLWFRDAGALRMLEPGLMAGTVVVITYGVSERLVPGVLHFHHSLTAGGRLEQPLTYWNAMGELAAIGLVLATRLAGDRSRPTVLRAWSAAATAPLGLGLYLAFSRGALFAAAAGLVALVVLARRREQLAALAIALAAAVVSSAAAAPLGGITGEHGSLATRETQGAIMLAVLVFVALVAGLAQRALARRGWGGELALARHASLMATAVIVLALVASIVLGTKETSQAQPNTGASRLTSLQTDRYAYWDVALRAFSAEPVHGIGAENWWLYWLRYRHTDVAALDVHSLELQTLAELGLVGGLLLLVFVGGMAAAARRAHRLAREPAAGLVAGAIVYLLHSLLDWDWQMPALTLVAIGLAGGILALAESGGVGVTDRRGPTAAPELHADAVASGA